ncbi:response regulator transcription factor [Streptomyces cuspidosporus]|uniref:Response regulator transcription factor n=1 Tax=Streptomyces cuspidosporus TaxID=66882 RepID=A0ABP5T0R2_9ACTN
MDEGRGLAGPRAARVLVVDDQIMVREGIVLLLGLLPGIEVVGAAGDGEDALRLVAELAPDVVLMDLRMPRCDGVEATRRIRAGHPSTQVVVVTTYADDDWLFPALRAGARGYVTKDAGAEEIARAIEDVVSGQAALSPGVQRRLLERLVEGAEGAEGAAGGEPLKAAPARRGPLPDGLTPREAEVLALVAEGLANAEIARRLRIGQATVKTHINNLFAKAGVRDRAQAVRYAYRSGIARPPGPDSDPEPGSGPGVGPGPGPGVSRGPGPGLSPSHGPATGPGSGTFVT